MSTTIETAPAALPTAKRIFTQRYIHSSQFENRLKERVGISRAGLNIRAFVGIFIFGWLMIINFDALKETGLGWMYMIATIFFVTASQYDAPHLFYVASAIYAIAWIHANLLLTERQKKIRKNMIAEAHEQAS